MSIYCGNINNVNIAKIIVFVNSNKIYERSLYIYNSTIFTHQYHDIYLSNNHDYTQSFNGKFYDYSMVQNITESEALNLHEYYKYIHNV